MKPITFRASRTKPCPVCGAGTKGCSATDDGLHFCRGDAREGWRRIGPRDGSGFLHYRREGDRPPGPGVGKATGRGRKGDWTYPAPSPELRQALADALRLPVEALDCLAVGWDGKAWTLPEFDGKGRQVGVARRFPSGKKCMVKGGHRGLTLPKSWRDKAGPVLVVEGASDAIAATHAGLCCVGRPGSACGEAQLAELLADWPADRGIVLAAENDPKEDGSWPGREGAISVARELARRLGRAVPLAHPPAGAKDLRAWLSHEARGRAPWRDRGAELLAHLLANREAVAPDAGGDPEAGPDGEVRKGKNCAADLLAAIALEGELWHDAAQSGYATVGGRTYALRSKAYRHWLVNAYRKGNAGKVPNAEAVSNALAAVEAVAVHDGPECRAFVRVAGHGGKAYLHLADEGSTVVEIDGQGWRVCPSPPVRFRKPAGMSPLPFPVEGGTVAELRGFLNVPDDHGFALELAFLASALRPDGPFPVALHTGEHGCAKSTAVRVEKRLIDPSAADLRSGPKDVRDLMIASRNAWLITNDNVSHFPDWLSDAVCRLSTGGGFGTRALFENDEEVIFDAKRPVALNGIGDFATRADLLDRALVIRHPRIPEAQRRTEADFWAAFDAARPRLLGALLTRVSAGLRELPHVRLGRLPRMADLALFAVACERGAGEPPRFMAAYGESQTRGHEQALEEWAASGALVALCEARGPWKGTPTELLGELESFAESPPPKDWPKGANAMTQKLRRLAPSFKIVHGIDVDCDRREGRQRQRTVTVGRCEPDAPSAPSAPPPDAGGPANRPPEGGRGRDGAAGGAPSAGSPGPDGRAAGADGAGGASGSAAGPFAGGPDLSALFH